MQIKQLEYFLTASECRSMSEAAEKLYITQPTLSASISALENELGISLFMRTNKGIALTLQGMEILEECQSIVETVHRWQKKYLAQDNQSLHLYATPIICSTVLADSIIKLKKQYPDINFELHEKMVPTPETPPNKKIRTLAIGLYETPDLPGVIYRAQKNGWVCEKIFDGNTYVFLNPQNPLAQKSAVSINELAQFSIVSYSTFEKDFPYGHIIQSFKKRNSQNLPNREAQFKAIAESSEYIGIFSELVTNDNYYLSQHQIIAVPIIDPPLPVSVLLFYPNKNLSPVEKAIISIIKKNFADIAFSSHSQ